MKHMNYYDIESLDNVFTLANFKEEENHVDIYILCDNPSLTSAPDFPAQVQDRIYWCNHNFSGTVKTYDLGTQESCEHLAMTFGLSDAPMVNNPKSKSSYPAKFRPVCDTDPGYDPARHPFFGSYNGQNYDTTMLALFFYEVFFNRNGQTTFKKIKASMMREYNDDLFSETFKNAMPSYLAREKNKLGQFGYPNYSDPRWRIRRNMLMTGRQIDISVLNEKQRKVGLKRLLGMMGFQILESDKLDEKHSVIADTDELLDLIGYNASDVINLAKLANLKYYNAQFDLKHQLLHTYPELVYEKMETEYAPDKRPEKVRKDRLFVDSTSAQFAQKSLSPYGHLDDMRAVSFMYPHPEKAKEYGITPVNVLEEAKKFFYDRFPQPEVRAQFDNIYRYYKSIEGKNFNSSDHYREIFKDDALPVSVLKDIPKVPNCIPYFDKYGKPTSCFVNFSTGGVHGAEYNKELFDDDMFLWEQLKADFEYVTTTYPDADAFRQQFALKPKEITLPNGEVWTTASFNRAAKELLKLSEEERKELKAAIIPVTEITKTDVQQLQDTLCSKFNLPSKNDEKAKEFWNRDDNIWEKLTFNKTVTELLKLYEDELSEEEQEAFKASTKLLTTKTKQNMRVLLDLYPNIYVLDDIMNRPLGVPMPDGRILPVTIFLAPKKKDMPYTYKDVMASKPELFVEDEKGNWSLCKKYSYTSSNKANHEDFTSYYPNLLRMMMAFFNPGLGYDRYAEVFQQKQDYGKLMKDDSISKDERSKYSILREGTKLLLNSASGAGDATFDNNILMNNTIISMRIIGQLFSWRIGQAQTFEGAKIISTNTDGLYSVMEENRNNQILERESKNIGVEIEPEPLFLISKDTNNRLELTCDDFTITGASGGTVGCRKGPTMTKALAHPAIIDWALSEYLTVTAMGYKGLSMDKPFNETIGRNILQSAIRKHDPVEWLRLFQNVIASSPGSVRYNYAITDEDTITPIILRHYNRVFYMKDRTPGTVHLWSAVAKVISEATQAKRKRDGERYQMIERQALQVLQANGVDPIPNDKDIVHVKVTGIENEWYVYIQNKDLHDLTQQEFAFILDNLDYEKYLELLKNCYEDNWRNHLPNRNYVQFFNMGECKQITTSYRHAGIPGEKFPAVYHPQEFAEWNTEPDGTGTILLPNQPIETDMTVYAVYQSDKQAAQACVS